MEPSRNGDSSINLLLDVMGTARKVFEGTLETAIGSRDTTGTCLFAAVLLRGLIIAYVPGATALIRGGDGEQDGGCRNVGGALRGHYWVEVELVDGTRGVTDITADQFGHPPVRWLPLPGAAAMYRPGQQATVDESVHDIEAEMGIAQRARA